jgi:hypothetical protein
MPALASAAIKADYADVPAASRPIDTSGIVRKSAVCGRGVAQAAKVPRDGQACPAFLQSNDHGIFFAFYGHQSKTQARHP